MTDYSDIRFAVETVTPELATRYLAENTHNRKLSERTVRRYAKSIRAGEWRVNGEALKFNGNGKLLDGQHRLAAIVRAKTPVDVCVIRGIDDAAFKTIDAGRGRSAGDCLYVLKYAHPNALAAAGRVLFAYECEWSGYARSFRTVTNDELLTTIERHPKLVAAAHEYMRKPLFTRLVPHSVGMVTYYLARCVNPAGAKKFYSQLSSGNYYSDKKTHPPRVLRERLVQTSQEILKPSGNTKLAWVVQAWNSYHGKQPLPRLSRLVEKIPRFSPDPVKQKGRRW